MNILINASNLKAGGGLQVADSICRELGRFTRHHFIVVLSSYFDDTCTAIEKFPNAALYKHDVKSDIITTIQGRDEYFDNLVKETGVDVVLTIFGPSVWIPQVPHLCGFARAQMVIKESPFYTQMGKKQLLIQRLKYGIRESGFKRCAKYFYTENPYISARLEKMWHGKNVYTVTNYYNQVFDHPEQWKEKALPKFDGITLLTIATPYPHKNLSIAADSARLLREQHPDLRFRFVLSNERSEFPADISEIEDRFEFIGKVDIGECPSLYQQCDIVFQPTLLECFTAAYPEAMRMERPIITTDLEFARGLCGEAAEYYSAIDAQACADAIYKLAIDRDLRDRLVSNGKEQLSKYDNYSQRAEKLIELTEKIVKMENE